MDEHFSNHEYRTGPTQPQKNRRGLVAILLILIIFLSGLVCAMGLLNIRLTRLLNKTAPKSPPLSFSQGDGETPELTASGAPEDSFILAGMTCQELTDLCQDLYDLPDGLYVSAVTEGSHAALSGIAPGDVLTHFAGTPISRLEDLQSLLNDHPSGKQVDILASRNRQQLHITLTIDD